MVEIKAGALEMGSLLYTLGPVDQKDGLDNSMTLKVEDLVLEVPSRSVWQRRPVQPGRRVVGLERSVSDGRISSGVGGR